MVKKQSIKSNPHTQLTTTAISLPNRLQPSLNSAPPAEPTTDRASRQNMTPRQPAAAHPLQQATRTAQKKKLETMKGIVSVLTYQYSTDQNITNAQRFFSQLDLLIKECSKIPEGSRREIISDNLLSECHHFRAVTRKFIEKSEGLNDNFKKLAIQIYCGEVEDKTDVAMEQNDFIAASEKILQYSASNFFDVKQAISLCTNAKKLKKLSAEYHGLCRTGALTRLSEAQVLLYSGYFESEFKSLPEAQAKAMLNHNEHVLSAIDPLVKLLVIPDHENGPWPAELNPILDDFSNVCLDYAINALEITAPSPSQNYDAEKIARTKKLTNYISYLFTDLPYWLSKCRGSNTSQANQSDSELICVRGPSGLHTPAMVQSDGSARGLDEGSQQYLKNSDGTFSAAGETSSDDDDEIEWDEAGNTQAQSSKQARLASKSLQRAITALSKFNVEDEIAKLRARKGRDHPDHVISSYLDKAKAWETESQKLRALVQRLDSTVLQDLATEEEQSQACDLCEALLERANQMGRYLQELRDPETHFSLMKAYVRPHANHWAQLLSAGHIKEISRPKKLPTETPEEHLYEVRITPRKSVDGDPYKPVWLHLHAKKEMLPADFKKAELADYHAAHLKSTAQKNLGAKWKAKQRQEGNHDAEVYRSPIDADLLSKLMTLIP